MNVNIFLLFAICFLAFYCHGMKNEESSFLSKMKDGLMETLAHKKSDKNSNNSKAVKKPQTNEVKLNFEKEAPFTLLAFRGNDEKPFYSAETKKYKRNGNKVWQLVMMPIHGIGLNQLKDEDVIKFKKDGEETVLGSATKGTFLFVNEAAERNEHAKFLDFTAERRHYYHKNLLDDPRTVIIFYRSNGTTFVLFKKIKLTFKQGALLTVQAFHGDKLLYSGKTKPELENGQEMWQYMMMPVAGKQWEGLNDNEKITLKGLKDKDVISFKNEKGQVFGSATVGTLLFLTKATEWEGFSKFLNFTEERRDYYHENLPIERQIILYKIPISFLFKKIKLIFPKDDPITVQAYHGDKLLYSGKTQPEIRDNKEIWQYVMMPVDGKQWIGLDDNEKIILKTDKGRVLGTATAQVLLKTSVYWLEFDDKYNYFYRKEDKDTKAAGVFFTFSGYHGEQLRIHDKLLL